MVVYCWRFKVQKKIEETKKISANWHTSKSDKHLLESRYTRRVQVLNSLDIKC